jgi:hypothetical protein
MSSFIATALIAGAIVNVADIAVTLMFAAKPWNEVLVRQGISPSPLTPPYYIAANFIGAALLLALYQTLAALHGAGAQTALTASIALWFVTRIYGGGHAVMKQMPWKLLPLCPLDWDWVMFWLDSFWPIGLVRAEAH